MDKKKKVKLPRGLMLGDIIYLRGADEVWFRQDGKDTLCLGYCCSEEEFFELARLFAQAAGLFDVKEIEIPEDMIAMIAYEVVEEEEEEEEEEVKAEAEAVGV